MSDAELCNRRQKGEQLDRLASAAIGEASAPLYDHSKWFYGSEVDPAFPWGGGYSLGYALVRQWLLASQLKASQAVETPASSILPTAWTLFGKAA